MENQDARVKSCDVGVDWITCTFRGDTSRKEASLLAHAGMAEAERAGDRYREWRNKWYEGDQVGAIRLGHRREDTMVQVSGAAAQHMWRALIPHAHNVSRLDIQVTVVLTRANLSVAADGFALASTTNKGRGKPPKIGRYYDNQSGDTLYFGCRSSAYFLRLYDKGVESGSHAPGLRWRYEGEVKGKAAFRAATTIRTAPEEARAIGSAVHALFSTRGVIPLFRAAGEFSFQNGREPTDRERTLEWLACSVRPTLQRAAREGWYIEALNALGLNDLVESAIIRHAA
jgi:hypothetical protein